MLSLVQGRQLLLAASVAGPLILAGCGGTTSGNVGTAYPTVVVPPSKHGPPITTPNGAVVSLPVPPRVYSKRPSAGCEWVAYQSGSNKRPGPAALSPPAPGLKAIALSPRTIRIEYSFRSLPDDCRPSFVLLSIVASRSVRATPNTEQFPIHGLSGKHTLTYYSGYPPPDVAIASAGTNTGSRSRTVEVLIRR